RTRCAECHTNGKYKGSFSLDIRSDILKKKAVAPGNSAASELYKRITSSDLDERMPAKGEPLTTRQIGLIKDWIDQGLPWEEGFSFKTATYVAPLKPRRPTLPAAGPEHPIDRIVAAYFAAQKVPPPAALDDRAFLRRVYLDVI